MTSLTEWLRRAPVDLDDLDGIHRPPARRPAHPCGAHLRGSGPGLDAAPPAPEPTGGARLHAAPGLAAHYHLLASERRACSDEWAALRHRLSDFAYQPGMRAVQDGDPFTRTPTT